MGLKKDYWIAIICKAVVILTELLITILINRGLGVVSKGEYAYVMKVVEVLYILCSVGLGQAYATFRKRGEEKLRDLFVLLGLLQSILVLVCGFAIVKLFSINYGIIIVILTALAVMKFIFSMIAVIEKSILRNIIQAVINIVYLIILAILFFTDICSLTNVLFCYGMIEIARIIIICLLYKLKPSFTYLNRFTIQSIYKIGFTTMILMLLITLNYSIDIVMIRSMSTSYSTGIYSVGVNFSSMFLMIPEAFKDVLFGDASKNNFNSDITNSALKVSVGISILGIIVWIIFGKLVINFLYGKDYLNSYIVTIILFFGCIPLTFFKILQPIFIADGNQAIACVYLGISVVSNIIANYFLIPQIDYIGAALASVLSYSVCGGLFLINYQKRIKKESIHE